MQSLSVTLEHHALHLVRTLDVRVAVHLVPANANLPFNQH